VNYDSENRLIDFYRIDSTGGTTVHCTYDHMGRRATKQVTVGNKMTLRQRYIYRSYLQIACIDLTRSHHPALWFITWDPTQPVATRPLAIQKDGSWFTYGWDLTKNICDSTDPPVTSAPPTPMPPTAKSQQTVMSPNPSSGAAKRGMRN